MLTIQQIKKQIDEQKKKTQLLIKAKAPVGTTNAEARAERLSLPKPVLTPKVAPKTGVYAVDRESRETPDVLGAYLQMLKVTKEKGPQQISSPVLAGAQKGLADMFMYKAPTTPDPIYNRTFEQIKALNPKATTAGYIGGIGIGSLPSMAIGRGITTKLPTMGKAATFGAGLAADTAVDVLATLPGAVSSGISGKDYAKATGINIGANVALAGTFSVLGKAINKMKLGEKIDDILRNADDLEGIKAELELPPTATVDDVKREVTRYTTNIGTKRVTEGLKAPSYVPKSGTLKVANVELDKAYQNWNDAMERIQNHFGTSELRQAEIDRIKPELGIDLDALVRDMDIAEQAGSPSRFKEALADVEITPEKARLAQTAGIELPQLKRSPLQPQIAPRQAIAPELPKTTAQGEIAPSIGIGERVTPEPSIKLDKASGGAGIEPKIAKFEPSPKVARVMTEPVKAPSIPLKEKAESVYQALVSTGRPLERIGGKVRDISSVIRKSAGSVDYVLGNKMIDREGNELGKSLTDIVGDVPKQQKEDLFSYAFHKHNIARMAQNKPVFGETVTPDVSTQAMAEIEARNPGIAEKATELNQYINNLMEGWALKSGLVNDDTLKTLREMYPDYVPTYRDRSELAKSMYGTKGAGLNVIKKAEGSSRDLLPLDQQIAEMTNRVIRSSRKNEMYNAMQDMAEAEPDKMARFFKVISKEKQNVEDGIESTLTTFDEPIKKVGDSYILNFFRDGEKVQAEISKDMYDALRSIGDMTDEQKVAQVIRKYGTNPFKSLITQYNPLFALSNVMRDIPTAFVYSHNGVEWAKNMPVALKEIVSNGQYWKEYQALGGTRSGIFTAEKGVKPLFKGEGNKVKEAAGKTLEGVEWFNNITETLPRFAEYLATVKKGGNTYDSKLLGMMRASEITTDFTRSGKATKFADAFVPYLNPSVQGIDKFFRQVATKPAQTAAKAGAIMTVPALVLDQINKDNQEYKETSAREKNGFYLVPDGEGKFYRIPKSRETGVVFSTMFEWMARRARGEQVTAKEMIDNVKENFSPVSIVDSTLFTPLYKAVKQIKEPESEVRNFAGIPIESLSLKRYAPGERYDQYTSEVAKAIGKQFDISPKAIDYLLRSYSGIVGQVLLPKTSQKGKPGLAGTFEAKFKSDPVFKSENQNKLYDVLEKKQQEANSLDREKGYTTSQDRKITTDPEKVVSALNKATKELADYRKQQKEIDADKSMDEKKKQEMIRSMQKLMNEKAKEALKKQGLWKE